MIPEFAVLGHPNEGKSSVVSTLTEDDGIKISRIPGETTVCRQYTVSIDGEKLIRFVDTPGFQVPQQTLEWFKAYEGEPDRIVNTFIDTFKNDPFYADECELLSPLTRGAGIIYVVDGSRPVRPDDLAEMEILRLTGRPRMAVINSKTDEKDFTEEWRLEFRKHFNAVRIFNSNRANFLDRILMLESLKSIDQEWEGALTRVIEAFRSDWCKRNRLAGAVIIKAIDEALCFSLKERLAAGKEAEKVREKLAEQYQADIRKIETRMFKKIRLLFKHHLFEVHLPEHSVLNYDLFSKQTWELLGLKKEQLAAAGAIIGGTMGAVLDTAAAGITFGVFTAIGGILGAGSAVVGSRKIAQKGRAGFKFGGDTIRLGPSKNLQFLYVLLDRALIYYSLIINRPHGRRDMEVPAHEPDNAKKGFSSALSQAQRAVCARYFKAVTGRSIFREEKSAQAFEALMESVLAKISGI